MNHLIAKLENLMKGKVELLKDSELDLLSKFDASNFIRSKMYTQALGLKDENVYECWIERKHQQILNNDGLHYIKP